MNRMSALLLILLSYTASIISVKAQDIGVTVENPYIRASIPGAGNTAAYMTLVNTTDKQVKLIKATSTISKNIEVHEHSMVNGVMKMGKIEGLVLPAKETVQFQPHGYHLMVFDVLSPLTEGDKVAITLYFDSLKPLTINYSIQGMKKAHHH